MADVIKMDTATTTLFSLIPSRDSPRPHTFGNYNVILPKRKRSREKSFNETDMQSLGYFK